MKVLIVEDSSDLRWALSKMFANYGLTAIEAEDGEAGLVALETHLPIFILTDIQMPKMNGIEFLKQARLKLPTLPIFVMSGESPYSKAEIVAFGASEYFNKTPLDFVHALGRRYGRVPA